MSLLLGAGLLVALTVLLIGGVYWRRRQNRQEQSAPDNVEIPRERIQKILAKTTRVEKQQDRTAAIDASSVHSVEEARTDEREDFNPIGAGETVPDRVQETVSVVLRRQVPIRFDDPPRSWVGGLPMLPEDVDWPYSVSPENSDRGERPLHFLAQICCADFPGEMWGGLGPRNGWLLYFVDPNQCELDGDGSFKIIHTLELGTERPAPSDLGPVYDGAYAGPRYSYLEPDGQVPKTWRRWPVDLVVVPNEVREENGGLEVTPKNFASLLYNGEAVSDTYKPDAPEPFTMKMALAVLHRIETRLSKHSSHCEAAENVVTKLKDPRFSAALATHATAISERLDSLHIELAEAIDESSEGVGANSSRTAEIEQSLEGLKRKAAFITRHPSVESLQNYVLRTAGDCDAWRESGLQAIALEKDLVSTRDPDEPLNSGLWKEIRERLLKNAVSYWEVMPVSKRESEDVKVLLVERKISLWQFYDEGYVGLWEYVSDYYTDPNRRALIPPDIIEQIEPWWRQLSDNRPHRIGGEFDALQSEPSIGPTGHPVLLHLASDLAMNWVWGDCGIIYFRISPRSLAEGRYDDAFGVLECF